MCAKKHIFTLCSLSVLTPSGLSPDTPIAGCSISHAWLPQAEQGNECKMPSWLKMRIITGVVRWAPTPAPCHLTAPQQLGASTISVTVPPNDTQLHLCCCPHTHGGSLIRKLPKQTLFCSIDFVLFCNQGSRPLLYLYGLKFIILALTREHEIWQSRQTNGIR